MITAININTDLWNKTINLLIKDDWIVTYKYNNFDAGIDFDFIILEKENEEILFGWDNWFEGEIQCSTAQMKILESLASSIFKKGEPKSLKEDIILLNKKWKIENK